MYQNRRTVFVFICSLVCFQAVYYLFTFQIKKPATPIVVLPDDILHEQTSDTQPTAITIKTDLVPFADASLSLNFTKPDPVSYDTLSICDFQLGSNESHRVTIAKEVSSFPAIEKTHGDGLPAGGHWFPTACRAEQRLALIVCYRDREAHLRLFLNNIHSFLQRQQLDYTIFVVNQHGRGQFNRAALFNVGFLEAMKLYAYTCFIFHDVDLLPEDLRNFYKCGNKPRHMSVAVDKFNYRLFYSTLFGGVTAFNHSDFVAAHGYPTVYWGWGGEDDDMYLRVTKKLKKSITRYPLEIARYVMIRQYNHTSGRPNPHRHRILNSKYNYDLDGLSTTRYQLHDLRFYRLFTLINVSLVEESFEQIRVRLNIKPLNRTSA